MNVKISDGNAKMGTIPSVSLPAGLLAVLAASAIRSATQNDWSVCVRQFGKPINTITIC